MQLNDLLRANDIDPSLVIVLRHRPEPSLNRVFDRIAGEKPELFNAYQQLQGQRLEEAMHRLEGRGYLASFIRGDGSEAVFVGLYSISGSTWVNQKQFWRIPENRELSKYGMHGFSLVGRSKRRWFDLQLRDFYTSWKGRLIVDWPPPARVWWRRAHKNKFPVLQIPADSRFASRMPPWEEISLTWPELAILPKEWEAALAQWRGIYHIHDATDGKRYVGAAYGKDNILGRWRAYAASGHGGNRLLKQRAPEGFTFSILQRVSPDMPPDDVQRLESTWKVRLHTRHPLGLNDN